LVPSTSIAYREADRTVAEFDGEVLSLDIAQAAQFGEERLPDANSPVTDAGNGTCSDDDRNPVLLRRLLRPRCSNCGREQ